jgi:toxin ParE1/3/4
MRRRVTRRPRARQDIIEQTEYLADEAGPETAEHFLDAVQHAETMLAEQPGLGAARDYGSITALRMYRVSGFQKHLIFYQPLADGIEVVRVLHSARDLQSLFDDDPV